MDVALLVAGAVLWALLIGGVGIWGYRRGKAAMAEEVEEQNRLEAETTMLPTQSVRPSDDLAGVLTNTLAASTRGAPRYEVLLSDWGGYDDNPAMRFRWTVWDADRILRDLLDLGGQDRVGIDLPHMLGNAPSQLDAYVAALAWIRDQDPDSSVVTARDVQ